MTEAQRALEFGPSWGLAFSLPPGFRPAPRVSVQSGGARWWNADQTACFHLRSSAFISGLIPLGPREVNR
jgi:hypothetical protein